MAILPQAVLKDIQTEDQLKKLDSIQSIQEDETNLPMQEKEAIAEIIHDIVDNDGINQFYEENMFTEEAYISVPCCMS